MKRLRLTLEYDGSDFSGWQFQPDRRTVQGVLEESLYKVTQERIRVVGAGRTDAGVHARGQVAHVDTQTRLRPAELQKALNAVLPEDLAVRDAHETTPEFHARHDAKSKRYVYRIWNGSQRSPVRRHDHWHVWGSLDPEAMQQASVPLLGEHDFSAFVGAMDGAPSAPNPVRTLDAINISSTPHSLQIEVQGRSFLRYMVRNLTGLLVEIGRGRRPVEDSARVLESRDRTRGAPMAPAKGLCLEQIVYSPDSSPR